MASNSTELNRRTLNLHQVNCKHNQGTENFAKKTPTTYISGNVYKRTQHQGLSTGELYTVYNS